MHDVKRIVAPVDFSEISNNAAEYAAALASQIGINLELLHIVQYPVVYGEVPQVTGVEYDRLYDDARNMLQNLGRRLKNNYPGLQTILNIKAGNAAEELRNASANAETYAIVMATHGAGAVERFFLGSNTHGLLKNSGCPIFIIPHGHKYGHLQKVALASDFQDVVKLTPDKKLCKVLEDLDARLEILHCDSRFNEYEPENIEAGLMLATMFHTQKPQFRFIHNANVEKSILDYANKNNVDIVAIVPKPHNFFEQLIGSTHTENFVARANLPILVLNYSMSN